MVRLSVFVLAIVSLTGCAGADFSSRTPDERYPREGRVAATDARTERAEPRSHDTGRAMKSDTGRSMALTR